MSDPSPQIVINLSCIFCTSDVPQYIYLQVTLLEVDVKHLPVPQNRHLSSSHWFPTYWLGHMQSLVPLEVCKHFPSLWQNPSHLPEHRKEDTSEGANCKHAETQSFRFCPSLSNKKLMLAKIWRLITAFKISRAGFILTPVRKWWKLHLYR